VLRHPTFVPSDVGGDSQSETLFTEQRISAVPRTIGPNFAGLREMDDVFFFVARPRHIFLTFRERRANGMHAWNDARYSRVDLLKNRQPYARHDAHINDYIWRIG